MAENQNTVTTVFKADISNFSKSTQDLNRYISTVNSEFKNAVAGAKPPVFIVIFIVICQNFLGFHFHSLLKNKNSAG